MAEEVNVLVFGHPGSGKSSIIGKVLELGGLLSQEQIERYKNKSKDGSNIEEKPDWYLNYVKAAKKKPTFARTFYQAGWRKFMFLEFQSDEDYFPKLMMKTKNATIGVLVLSGVFSTKFSHLEAIQTRKYIQLFRAICGSPDSLFHVSSKLIVLINKNDANDFHCNGLKRQMDGYLKLYGFDTSKVEIISVSSRSDKDIRFFLSRLGALSAEESYCLRPELCGKTTDPIDSAFNNMWDNLIISDVHLDTDSSEKILWRKRPEILYRAGTNLLEEKQSSEALRIIKVACKAAEKAIRDVEDILLSLILSHGHHENGNYQVAVKHYEEAQKLASKEKNLEGNILTYLLWGESRVDEAKKLVKKKSDQVAKSRRKDQQKVKNEMEKSDTIEPSDANEPEEAETNVVRNKLEDLEMPRKIVKISVKSSSTYSIDPEKRDTLYSGSRMILSRSSKKAFIPIKSSELQDYEDIEALGFRHPNMLALNDITESIIGDTPMVLLVAEDVDTIDFFFTRMFQKFVEDDKSSVELIRSEWSSEQKSTFMRSWWELIAKDFQIIFGDVVNGLLYLYSLGMPSGGLRDHIYVSGDKHGRILPLMDKMKTYEDDIVDLVKIMRDVIYQPRVQLGAKRERVIIFPPNWNIS